MKYDIVYLFLFMKLKFKNVFKKNSERIYLNIIWMRLVII